MLIIADDLTGAADCAAAGARNGIDAKVLLRLPNSPEEAMDLESVGVLSIDADTRGLRPEQAANTVEKLLDRLDALVEGYDRMLLFKKVDSTLRGNVAAEIAATLKVRRTQTGRGGRVVVLFAPASPEHGRTTEQGQQRVHGQALEHTDLWQDEERPARSDIAELLREVGLTCGLVELSMVRAGIASLEKAIVTLARDVDVVVCDAETDGDLRDIAVASMALGSATVWAGSAGLARHIPAAAGLAPAMDNVTDNAYAAGPTLFVVGSAATTSRDQARVLAASHDMLTYRISHEILPGGGHSTGFQELEALIGDKLKAGQDVLLYFDLAVSCSPAESPSLVKSLATMVRNCSQYAGALVVTGGETARAVLDEWGIRCLHLIGEVEPGLPFAVAEGWNRNIAILTKAGGFGTSSSLVHCREFLRKLKRAPSRVNCKMKSAITENAYMKPIIAITMGDAAGVGPEVIIKSLAHPEVYAQCRPLVIGDAQRLKEAAHLTQSVLSVRSLSADEVGDAKFQLGVADCVDLKLIPFDLPWGRLSTQAGDAAYQYLAVAARLALAGKVAAICTAPLNKEALQAAGHKFPGHTELLAHLTGTPEVSMMLTTPKMKVLHVTTHIGLIDAIAKIEPALVERTIARGHAALEKTGILNPRIGVCGINPHAGENGLFGYGEEEQKIAPAIAACRERGWNVEGPLPADTLFYRAQRGDFDLVVAMYHDQGHGPVKVLGLESGVNITIGLPVVRTSVDHGTAFDIAGTGQADERSMLEAIRQAVELAPRTDSAQHTS
jgi:4-phospho-D-threonate 3-dehydrogenase / 4-phospho-D-erythronate 3-dehydrogenase